MKKKVTGFTLILYQWVLFACKTLILSWCSTNPVLTAHQQQFGTLYLSEIHNTIKSFDFDRLTCKFALHWMIKENDMVLKVKNCSKLAIWFCHSRSQYALGITMDVIGNHLYSLHHGRLHCFQTIM